MCGRYSLESSAKEIVEAFELAESIAFAPRYNIAPTQKAPIVRMDRRTHERRGELVRWGLEARFTAKVRALINLRSETVGEKPLFRDALRRRRCLVPATGFYEWQRLGRARQPFHVAHAGGGLLAFAGLWDRFVPEGGGEVEAFVILTTRPNALVAPIHDRMPVILDRAAWARWLDVALDDPAALSELLVPAPDGSLSAHPVGTLVNNPARDEPACSRPLGSAAGPAREREEEGTLWDQ